jgi:putative ATP-binding cassette transporter
MKLLSGAIALLSVLALAVYWRTDDLGSALLFGFGLVCGYTTLKSGTISTFLKIFVSIFSVEVVLFGGAYLLSVTGNWPTGFEEYRIPESLPLTVAMFSALVWAVSHLPVVRSITNIADRYFESDGVTDARVWPFAAFRVSESRLAVTMVIFLVVINQAQVAINIRLSFFNRDWFNAIQAKDAATFWSLLFTVFLFWAAIFITAAIAEFVVQSMLIIRWRRWLTQHYIGRWLDGATHYRMALKGINADNPDQRISEDVTRFIDGGQVGYGIYSYSILLISTLSSLVSFAVILWTLSADFTIPGTDIAVPGFLFWVALVYSAIGTLITHWIGRSLIGLSFERQRYEADFRFSLARLREYNEQIALLKGEPAERQMAMGRFGRIYANYLQIVERKKRLMAFTASYGQISPFIPYIVAAPFYFIGKVELGVLTQTADAFGRVGDALNFFVNYYTSLADFKAVLDRLTGFDSSIDQAQKLESETLLRDQDGSEPSIEIENLSLALPNGRTIVKPSSIRLNARKPTLVTGPSGSGKSTLFRAIAGLWPYGSGVIEAPADKKVMLLPQKPYIPIGTLRSALAYPAEPDAYNDAQFVDALKATQLDALIEQIDMEENWSARLSGGEQQRVAVARALLAKPDWLFLDEATSALDEPSEARLYNELARQLPESTIVSIGHRSSLLAFHRDHITFERTGDGAFVARTGAAA